MRRGIDGVTGRDPDLNLARLTGRVGCSNATLHWTGPSRGGVLCTLTGDCQIRTPVIVAEAAGFEPARGLSPQPA
jgi:hypothetical protein